VRPAEFYSAQTGPKQQREEFPLGAQASDLCSVHGAEPPSRGRDSGAAAKNPGSHPATLANRWYLL